MPLTQTYEEYLASKINPRNYSDILPIIYNLRKRQDQEYIPQAFDRTAPTVNAVGQFGAAGIFSELEQPAFNKGDIVALFGTATYRIVNGGLSSFLPAIKITAQIDIGRDQPPTSLPAFQVECLGSQIQTKGDDPLIPLGSFRFGIPASITEQLSVGDHYVYLDAHAPDNPPSRLVAQGGEAVNNVRKFTILG